MIDNEITPDEASALPNEPTGAEFDDDQELTGAPEPESSTRRPVSAKAIAAVGARVALGAVGIGVAAATILGSSFLEIPSFSASAPSELVVPVPTAQQLTCPGPLLRLSDDSGAEASSVFTLGQAVTRFASSAGTVEQARITASDAQQGESVAEPLVLSAAPDAQSPESEMRLSGAQSQSVSVGDYDGFASAGCRAVGGDSWLVGGATTTGRSTLISLINPTEVASTVTLDIYDERGTVSAAGTAGIVVPPNGQRVLSLAGFVPGASSPVVHVTSTGGQITAELQQTIVRGLDAGGVEIVGQTQAPSRTLVIPSMVVTNLEAVQALRGSAEQTDDVIAAIRVFVPGDEPTTMTATLTPADTDRDPITFTLDLSAGVVTDIPIEELATGEYTVAIESEDPIVAAARTTSGKLNSSGEVTATDFAWFTASPPLTGDTQLTIATGLDAVLNIANPSEAGVTLELAVMGEESEEYVIDAGQTLRLPVDNGDTLTANHSDRLFASVTQAENGFLSSYAIDPQTPGSSPLTVFP
ncbi:hypothetical protein ESZ53_05650 [Salinibacterium sp. UTAS2018]|uniref:DUF5719 family protein n=1 Tax=Salinibacterium sp. UTAS2018 TaxID=2508880 RepID=UPI0010094853|nr:DUF5719 family protein [Salinibacterium sp. UTAS2018]QAV69962.1 hypothetical protein ESZ53_05650 [Salinibacterium sp. UTAS2018]